LELPRTLNVAIADPGAVADLTASLAEGAAAHVAEVAKRVPGARLVVQLDEPALSAVAGGEVPTASGLSRIAPVEADVLRERLAQVIAGTGKYTVVHSCSTAVPFGIIRAAGAGALSFDLSQLRRGEEDGVAEVAGAGLGLFRTRLYLDEVSAVGSRTKLAGADVPLTRNGDEKVFALMRDDVRSLEISAVEHVESRS
jgi:hypothetical protein